MFGFQGGERADTVARKKGYMQDAQQRWGFMTYFDLSTIQNKVQLSSMVKDRSGISEAQAKSDVQAWMRGKQFWHGVAASASETCMVRQHYSVRMSDNVQTVLVVTLLFLIALGGVLSLRF